MTRDQVLRIATQCGDDVTHTLPEDLEFLERFAEAVAAEEREACAKVCEEVEDEYRERESLMYAELRTDAPTGASDCAYRIRARGEK